MLRNAESCDWDVQAVGSNMRWWIRQAGQYSWSKVIVKKTYSMYIDQKMSFNTHVYQAIAKTNRLLGVIRRAYKFLDRETLLRLYPHPPTPKT